MLAAEPGTAFVPFVGPGLADIVCEHHDRTVGRDNCVRFDSERLQNPAHTHRYHFVKARVRVHRYPDGRLAVFHGPRTLADYEPDGSLVAGAEATGQDNGRARGGAAGGGVGRRRSGAAGRPGWDVQPGLVLR